MANDMLGDNFERALNQAVKPELRAQPWPVYKHYEIVEEEGKEFVVAPLRQGASLERFRKSGSRTMRLDLDFSEGADFYAPLTNPALVIDLAYLAEGEITAEIVRRWARHHGLLGVSDDKPVERREEYAKYRVRGPGRRDSVARFAEAAREIRVCIRTYEAVLQADGGPLDLEALDAALKPLPNPMVLEPWGQRTSADRPLVLRRIGTIVQKRISEHCFPKLNHYPDDGRFELSYGFKNLLGAIWLQMAWVLSVEERSIRWCKLPDCGRVVFFELGEQPPLDAPKGERGTYKTRKDKVFCSHNCAAKYSYRKGRGKPGYT